MYVLEIVADNIYSFKNKTQVRFDSPSATLVGANNAGKSNVFRLLRLLIAELDHPGRELVLSDTFASGKKASVSVKLALTEMESLGIFSFLDFYFSNKFSDFRFVESHILSPYLRNITVDIEWEQTHYSTHEHLASTLNFNFDQLGFSFIRLSTGEWRIRSKGASYHIHKEGIECFQKLTDSVEQFGSTLDNILASSSKSSSIGLEESLPLKARFTDSRGISCINEYI